MLDDGIEVCLRWHCDCMCGISLVLGSQQDAAEVHAQLAELAHLLQRRGPDYQGTAQVTAGAGVLAIHATLLQLRGSSPSCAPLAHSAQAGASLSQDSCTAAGCTHSQPGCDQSRCSPVLAFNGEVFGGLDVPQGCNDAQVLFQALTAPGAKTPQVLSRARGPWALLFWDAAQNTLWFGRDAIGRRSLLAQWPSSQQAYLTLTSVAPGGQPVPDPSSGPADGDDDGPASSQRPVVTAATWQPWLAGAGWQEVPPGLYSLRLLQQALGAPADVSTTHPVQGPAGGTVDTASTVTVWEGLLAGQCWRLDRHAWQEPQLVQLQQYQRPAGLVLPPGQPDVMPAGSVPRSNAAALQQAQQRDAAAAATLKAAADQQQPGLPVQPGLQPDDAATSRSAEASPPNAQPTTATGTTDTGTGPGPNPLGAVKHKGKQKAKQKQKQGGATGPACACAPPHVDDYGVATEHMMAVLGALKAAVQVRCTVIEHCTLLAEQTQTQPQGTTNYPPQPATLPPAPAAATQSASYTPTPHTACGPVSQTDSGHVCTPLPPAPVLILFSGGVDSTLLAALSHQCLPIEVPIDLSNVCFNGGRSPDRLAALSALGELRAYAPQRQWRLILTDATLEDVDANRSHILDLLHPAGTVMDLNIGAALWLAVRADGYLEAEPALQQATGSPAEPRQAESARQGAAGDAAGSAGTVQSGTRSYRSEARVVLMGHGADEQCAGYGRHRTRFAEGGWSRLSAELALDVGRIWLRNLGRDDRLVADWGREARHPFLDEDFMCTLLNQVPLYETANLCLPPGVGDKRVLRAALAHLGLPLAANRIKRAIQFGTRIGHLSNIREFGSNRQANKASAGTVSLSDLNLSSGADRAEQANNR